ncbi:MAG: M20/M25/M40 family metallo-hydrolase [Oscillospiraceae bacterium]|nr:M20/M25/M40 family metallo-hydrolase [Oscillospiraceae bacterium]MDD3832344.1 M20/M25/M40 family metallo-hydrolase [Oscillospiraceae bacterium]MDD4546622.1 M20/M25/M40 family metallo-hydrolase [Oscillospiraceae bacterium]
MTRLKELCALEGVSGREGAVREYILRALEASPAEIQASTDALGNIIAHIRGEKRATNKLAFVAHMDEVGFIITGATDEGFLRFSAVGGIDSSVIFGRRVRINGRYGVIGGRATHQLKGDDKKKEVPLDKLLIDVAAQNKQEALKIAKPGDVAVFDSDFVKLRGDRIKARAIDDRGGCALLLEMAAQTPEYDITLAFTVQEEVGLRGAKTAAFQIEPDIAVVVDSTTAADIAGVKADKQVCKVGGGPVISFMDKRTLYDIELYDTIFETAKKIGVTPQAKSMVAGGNDAGAVQLSRTGVRVAAISLPCRYLHSPSCVISEADFNATLKLLHALTGEFACMGT